MSCLLTVEAIESSSSGLSDGAKAGIIVAVILVVILLIILIYIYCMALKRRREGQFKPKYATQHIICISTCLLYAWLLQIRGRK